MSDFVEYALEDDVATLTLRDPDRLNCFSDRLVAGLHSALDRSQADNARHIIFRADGKGFSGGFDLSGLADESDADLLMRLVKVEHLLQRVRHHDCSTTALVHGACYGAAADLVLACRNRIATADARFLMPGIRFGIVLGTRRLRDTLGEATAYKLLDRLKPFNSEEGLAAGFVTTLAEQQDWNRVVASQISLLNQYTTQAYIARMRVLTPDTRDGDMAALVGSVIQGSIKSRMQAYVNSIKKK